MKKCKKFMVWFLTLVVFASSTYTFNTTVNAYMITKGSESDKYRYSISDLSDVEIQALDDVSVTDKEMLDDIIERSYNNDFQSKTYIVKTEGDSLDTTYWLMYLESKGDFPISYQSSEGNYIATVDGFSYHSVTITTSIALEGYYGATLFNYDSRTVERWEQYNDAIKNIEQNIGILDDSLCDYQKIQLAYIWIKQNVKYGTLGHESTSGGQSPIEAVLDGYAVCGGYSRIFNRFMHDCGIDSYWVDLNYMSHAYNLVELDGKYYRTDCQTGTLSSDPGYEQYNSNGKLLWILSDGLVGMSEDCFDYYNQSKAIFYYDSELPVSGLKGGRLVGPLAEVTLPTCTEDGTFLKEGKVDEHCDYCGEIHSFTLPAAHTYETAEVKQPTCIEEGYVKKVCTECGYEKVETLDKLEHSYTIGARDSSCQYEGEFIISCKNCGDVYYVENTEKTNHTMSDWITYSKCDGYEYRYCTDSSEEYYGKYTEYKNLYTNEIVTEKPTSSAYDEDEYPEELTSHTDKGYGITTWYDPEKKDWYCIVNGITVSMTQEIKINGAFTNNRWVESGVLDEGKLYDNDLHKWINAGDEVDCYFDLETYTWKIDMTVYSEESETIEAETTKSVVKEETTTVKQSNPNVEETTTQPATTSQPETTTSNSETSAQKPARVTLKSSKTKNLKGKKIKVSWKKVTGATNYQIKLIKGRTTIIQNVSASKTTCTIRNLKKNKTYTIYVRAKSNSGWGRWSKRKKVKIKR
jgi:hypothetical protein